MVAPFRFFVLLLAAILVMPGTATAQPTASNSAQAGGPRLDATASAMRLAPSSQADDALLQVRRSNSVGKPLALIIVGGGAVVLGAIMGGDIGLLFMIGGAVALLYGLYQYFR